MAVSAVYVDIHRVNIGGGQSEDGITFLNISSTTAAFDLKGGLYEVKAMGTSFGSLTLQALAANESTYLTQATAITANGTALVYCAPGAYRWALA